MTIDKNETEKRHNVLMEAFCDKDFQADLEKAKEYLEGWLREWASKMGPLDDRIPMIFSIESRVKGEKTFKEKLHRKGYIEEWDVTDNIQENQRLIMYKLTDLIGLRVNCPFMAYEKLFFDYFQSTSESELEKGFLFNFKENIEQKNGYIIYKFSGLFQEAYHFEVQIKSITHNVWGEVEHKTVYKNPVYDGFFDDKKKISAALHDAMVASDTELLVLFNMKESKEQLLRSLFFCETNDQVAKDCKTRVLGEHYNSYFLSFPDIEPIKQYVACKLSKTEYRRIEISVKIDEYYHKLSEAVKNTFPSFYIECLYHIDSLVHKHESFETFMVYFLQNVVPNGVDDFDRYYSKDFNGQEEGLEQQDPLKDSLVKIDEILGTRIFDKEDKKR